MPFEEIAAEIVYVIRSPTSWNGTGAMSDDHQYYFKFRQIIPRPPGSWVVCGPYNTYDEAKRARETAKAWDAEVSIPFSASSKEEAEKRNV
jgi:hypothetical protein